MNTAAPRSTILAAAAKAFQEVRSAEATKNHRCSQNKIHARRACQEVKTAEARHEPESCGNRAEDRAQRVPRIRAPNRGGLAGLTGSARPAMSTTTAGKLNPKTSAVGSMASALVTN